MAVNWTIATLERNASDDGVIVAHWTVSDVEEVVEGEEVTYHTGQSYGTSAFSPNPEADDFVAFADITEEIAVQWCQDSMGEEQVTSIEESIANQIAEQASPSIFTGVPWNEQN